MFDTCLVLDGNESGVFVRDQLALSFLAKPLGFGLHVDARRDNRSIGEHQVKIEDRVVPVFLWHALRPRLAGCRDHAQEGLAG